MDTRAKICYLHISKLSMDNGAFALTNTQLVRFDALIKKPGHNKF